MSHAGIEDARVAMALAAYRKLGHLYLWGAEGGDEAGFDCSGLISEVLTEVAAAWPGLYSGGRRTASGLDSFYRSRGCEAVTDASRLRPGMIVFFAGASGKIFHVKLHLTTVPPLATKHPLTGKPIHLPIGPVALDAGGGGSKTTSPRASLQGGAGVRLSASDYHGTARWHSRDPLFLLA